MAYEKIGFNKGDVLKAEHLNHIEEGLISTDLRKNRTSIYFESWRSKTPIVNPTLDELKENPDNYCFDSGDFEFTDTRYFNPYLSKNNKLYYTPINSVEVGKSLVITINSSSSMNFEYIGNTPFDSIILLKGLNFTADLQLQLSFEKDENVLIPGLKDLVLMRNGIKIMDFRYLSIDPTLSAEYPLSYLGSVYGSYEFATDFPLFLTGSFIFHAKFIPSGNGEYLLQGFLEFITPYVIDLENFSEETLLHIQMSLALGQPIRLRNSAELPGSVPLNCITYIKDVPVLVFTVDGVEFTESGLTAQQGFVLLTLQGDIYVFIKDPTTGELIPQE